MTTPLGWQMMALEVMTDLGHDYTFEDLPEYATDCIREAMQEVAAEQGIVLMFGTLEAKAFFNYNFMAIFNHAKTLIQEQMVWE